MKPKSNTNDRHALLTTKGDQLPETNSPRFSKKCISAIIASILLIATLILIIFVFDVFDLFDEKKALKPGMIGLWPTYGGGKKNQQRTPYPENILFTPQNIQTTKINCVYTSENGTVSMGYPAIDNNNNSYFADASGYITCVNLDTCQECWRQHIGTLLGFDNNMTISVHTSITIFRDSNGDEGLLFGAPSHRYQGNPNYPHELGCFALAIHLYNGSFWWKITLGEDNKAQDYRCTSHGFYVDGQYGYGGFSQSCCYNRGPNDDTNFIGRFIKIDIDKHEIVKVWYPFHYNYTYKENFDEYNLSYSGISTYNFPAVDDDFVVFGTSNVWTIPYDIQACMLANYTNISIDSILPLNESVSMDVCSNEKLDNPYFRCLNKNVHPSSLIILDKKTFKLKHGFPLVGLDIMRTWNTRSCDFNEPPQFNTCPGYYFNKFIKGFNADLTAVSVYKNKINNKKYVLASSKAGSIYSFELETGKLHFAKKYAPQVTTAQFNMAIDEDNMIGITTMNGGVFYSNDPPPEFLWYDLANGLRICEGTGVIVAFDLNTGKELYQIVNPYGTINESICYNETYYANSMEYTDKLNSVLCDAGDELSDANVFVHIPPKSNNSFEPMYSKTRAKFRSPITIAKEMIFIPSDTGDIFVHSLYNGSFIHRFICPPQYVNGTYNRAAIKGGVSVVNDRIVVYCGGAGYSVDEVMFGNQFVSMQL